jgi:hypothetical protein
MFQPMRSCLLPNLAVIMPMMAALRVAATPTPVLEAAAPPASLRAAAIPFLHLQRGSLIESVAFSVAYQRGAPGEDCIVLVRPSPRGPEAVAVFTEGAALWVRAPGLGQFRLPGLLAGDINHRERVGPAVSAGLARRPDPGRPEAFAPIAAQLDLAAAAVDFFPSALSDVDVSIAAADGTHRRQKLRVLALDWDQRHFLWNPAVGTIEVPVPVDPVTRTPALCARRAEFPASVLFVREYLRQHPGERAQVLLDPILAEHPHRWFSRGVAVAAYTVGGRVWLHVPGGDVALETAAPADLADPGALARPGIRRYQELLRDPRAAAAAPNGLIGDTDELQRRRVHFRLQAANARPGRARGGPELLIIACGDRQYVYAPGHGAAYSGWLPPYRPLLLDGVLFAAREARQHPDERYAVLVHPPAGRLTYPPGGVNAHVFYTRRGRLWGHITEDHVGEYRVADAGAADLGDLRRLRQLCAENPAMAAAQARAVADILGADYERPGRDLPPFDARPFEPSVVLAELQAAGLTVRPVSERERADDGAIREFPSVVPAFRWAGSWYVYVDQKVFRARARGYDLDEVAPPHAR